MTTEDTEDIRRLVKICGWANILEHPCSREDPASHDGEVVPPMLILDLKPLYNIDTV